MELVHRATHRYVITRKARSTKRSYYRLVLQADQHQRKLCSGLLLIKRTTQCFHIFYSICIQSTDSSGMPSMEYEIHPLRLHNKEGQQCSETLSWFAILQKLMWVKLRFPRRVAHITHGTSGTISRTVDIPSSSGYATRLYVDILASIKKAVIFSSGIGARMFLLVSCNTGRSRFECLSNNGSN